MGYVYKTIFELIDLIDEPNKTGCKRLFSDNIDLFKTTPGSTHNHQAWPGGYLDHVTEAMNFGYVLFYTLDSLRDLPFTLSDLLLAVFLHDIEKPWKYILGPNGELQHRPEMLTKADHQRFRMQKLSEYGICLSPTLENGIAYAEGEISNYSNKERMMGPLAAVVHMCDVTSARVFFDYPLINSADDSWAGAERYTHGRR